MATRVIHCSVATNVKMYKNLFLLNFLAFELAHNLGSKVIGGHRSTSSAPLPTRIGVADDRIGCVALSIAAVSGPAQGRGRQSLGGPTLGGAHMAAEEPNSGDHYSRTCLLSLLSLNGPALFRDADG